MQPVYPKAQNDLVTMEPRTAAPMSLSSQADSKLPMTGATGSVPEILAPVGGREQFFAALNAGADAVFLGLKQFNARSRAENFTTDDLRTLVPLAKRYGMKVLVTLNILIKDLELKDLVDVLAELEDIGVHAIIVQDVGVARIARRYFPGLKLHASTQMAVHNLAGVFEAAAYGFKRVVLARELTAEEIKRIRRAVASDRVELEVFCHGSLCYSYSGLCFFSGAQDARSGNRGECAYTCREPYKVISEAGHGFLFSMRDLDTSHKLDQMVAAGVDTLKIEGRKKDAQYVSSVVRLYRKKLDELFGRPTIRESAPPLAKESLGSEATLRKDLQLSFQRQTTSFFFEGRYHENVIDLGNPTHHGIRVGVVEAVKSSGRCTSISVRLEDDVEKFDGLKIVPQSKIYHASPQDGDVVPSDMTGLDRRYENREIAFSLREISFKGRKIYEAARGMVVDVEIPGGSFHVVAGDILYKSRSDELRRRVETMISAPVDARLRPMAPVRLNIAAHDVIDGGMRLAVEAIRCGDKIASVSETFSDVSLRQKGEFIDDIKDAFHIFGDEGVYTESFGFEIQRNYFIPRSRLKELKRRLETGLALKASEVSLGHRAHAVAHLESIRGSLSPASEARYQLKIDRTEYLPWIAARNAVGMRIDEVVFEPKKMFLPDVKPESFLDPILDFSETSSIKVRLAVPTVVRAWDEPILSRWFKAAFTRGLRAYEVSNPGGIGLLKFWGLPIEDVSSDFMLYAMNRESVCHWQDQGVSCLALSIEDDCEDLQSLLKHWPVGVRPQAILYKDTPLFVAEACSLTALHNGCPTSQVCGYRTLEIENSRNERFFVAHEGCKSIVYGQTSYAISGQRHRLMALGVESFRIDFLTRNYERQEFDRILSDVAADRPIAGTHTANFHGKLK